ncbi:hypothetical protein DFS34DRAFT_639320 [Phlyctochytrium arcticum]|nr:hypothetical protein DFS34DRAFT_639320 [Phlyctochytrium arcticum]
MLRYTARRATRPFTCSEGSFRAVRESLWSFLYYNSNKPPIHHRLFSSTPTQCARRTHYQTLGVAHNADKKALKKQFYKLSMKYHPDKNPNDTAAGDKFIEINEAYTILNNDFKRSEYDRHLQQSSNPFAATRTGPRRAAHVYQRSNNLDPEEWILFRRKRPSSRPVYDFSKHEQGHYGAEAAHERDGTRQTRQNKSTYYRKMQEAERMEQKMFWTLTTGCVLVYFLFYSGLVHLIFLDNEPLDEEEVADRMREWTKLKHNIREAERSSTIQSPPPLQIEGDCT